VGTRPAFAGVVIVVESAGESVGVSFQVALCFVSGDSTSGIVDAGRTGPVARCVSDAFTSVWVFGATNIIAIRIVTAGNRA